MYISGQTKAGAVCVLSVSGFRLHDPIRILNLNLADLRFARLPTRAASRGFNPWVPASLGSTWRFMHSYKWSYKSPNMGCNYSYSTFNPALNPKQIVRV